MAKKETEKADVGVLVKMYRAEPQYPNGPVTAEVHPDEVDNFKAGGWQVEG